MLFVNLSKHPVDILRELEVTEFGPKGREKLALKGEVISHTLLPGYTGPLPTVVSQPGQEKIRDGILIQYPGEKVVHNLPEPQEGVYLVSSRLVMEAAKKLGRTDVLCPGPLVFSDPFEEGERGTIIGCRGLMG